MPIHGKVGEAEKGDAVRASKCDCVPSSFVFPALKPCGGEGNKFAPVGLADLFSCITPTPTRVSELAGP
jgi:hypothetical protein